MATFCRFPYRIPFSETDAMAIVHHSNHARYLERGRVEFLRLVDLNYSELTKQGFHFPLTEMKVTFKKPLVFDEVILIETAISHMTKVRMNFAYKIYSIKDLALPSLSHEPFQGTPSVIGETLHCCVNNNGRPVEMPPHAFEILSKHFEGAEK